MKILRITSCFLLIIMLACIVTSANAAVIYYDDGYYFQLIDDSTVSLAGYDKTDVPNLVIPRNYLDYTVTGVEDFALENNAFITSVSFDEAKELRRIGAFAFSGCSALESVLVPRAVTDLGSSVFSNCKALKNVQFYGNDDVVPSETFYNCSALENVRLSAYTKIIDSYAFAGCSSLEYLSIPESVSYIGVNAFDNAPNLTLGVWYDSYAYTYAKEQNIPYVLLDSVTFGDVNGDGVINIDDVTNLQRHIAQISELNELQKKAADVTHDNYLSIDDVTLIQRYLAEFDDAVL